MCRRPIHFKGFAAVRNAWDEEHWRNKCAEAADESEALEDAAETANAYADNDEVADDGEVAQGGEAGNEVRMMRRMRCKMMVMVRPRGNMMRMMMRLSWQPR
jgi:hypothetical protein